MVPPPRRIYGERAALIMNNLQPLEIYQSPEYERVFGEKLRLVYNMMPVALVLSVATAAMLVAVLWELLDNRMVVAGWLAAYTIVAGICFAFVRAYHRIVSRPVFSRRFYLFLMGGAFVAGLTWGVGGVLMFSPDDTVRQAILAVVLSGLTVGAVLVMAPMWSSMLAFVAPALLPPMGLLLLAQTPLSLPVGLFGAFFLLLLWLLRRHLTAVAEDDIHRRLELAARETENRLVFEQSPLGMFQYDNSGRIIECNARMELIIGSDRSRIIGLNIFDDLRDENIKEAARTSLTRGDGYYEDVYESVTADKKTPVRAFFSGIRDGSGSIIGGVAMVEDFTERKALEEALRQRAYYDELTGLPNRSLVNDRMNQGLRRARRDGTAVALLYVDLDGFKDINDVWGHDAGDELLADVAERLQTVMRESDTLGRIGGDEFLVVVPDMEDAAAAELVAERLCRALDAPFEIGGRPVRVSASVGLSLYPRDGETSETLLRNADAALYRAKAIGTGQWSWYSPELTEKAAERRNLETGLRAAVEKDEIELALQPVVSLSDESIIAYEALARWERPEAGEIDTARFIAAAEMLGIAAAVGERVYRLAFVWLAENHAEDDVRIAINVAPQQLQEPDFAEWLVRLAAEYGLAPSRIEVEITEQVFMGDPAEPLRQVRKLRHLGVEVSIDDFGTGYSSLGYLRRLPISRLKIDRTFVSRVHERPDNAAIVTTILALAKAFEVQVTAEGVESQAEADYLRRAGCPSAQGFLYGHPQRVGEMAERN